MAALSALVLLALAGCVAPAGASGPPIAAGATGTLSLEGRDFRLAVPPGYDPSTPAGLVVGLHGYGSDASSLDDYWSLTATATGRGLLVALPEGTRDSQGRQFWNATGACCDFDGSGVDDSAHLSAVIGLVGQHYAVDTARVFVVGHSNGGFMAHRLACEHADQVTGIVSLAGPLSIDPDACRPSEPVSVLQVHGTADDTVAFAGTAQYPSATGTVQRWAGLDGCAAKGGAGDALDLDPELPGAETTTTTWPDCRGGSAVALWTITDGGHSPVLSPDFFGRALDWLDAHAR